ncbi:hypothetical protein C923_02021 [Plasmodium falciparum UGT5.1]|uniref:Erythrocyte membrane protein 1, PfEMP1 n=1 Tax=Plasmodium falciparum UGT5.1 TaxID=1237627 RepID=W7JQM1_PLAFA|nr:hypothetical protein C923_02021 [Plasmodium falciparum UGT5.1]
MGSSASKFSKTVVGNETQKSARNVLEKIALETKGDINVKANKYEGKLKGKLSQAKFYHEYSKHRNVPENPCELDYIFHTNVWHDRANDRDPCLFSRAKRFSNEGEAECNGGIITGNKGGCGACAPYRRIQLCDYNLEHINKGNVLTTHDLLGNVLVMAKSEGESIVKNHPNRGSSEVCIALARSFADIGDIIRGRDMFKPNDKVENALREVFKNIHDKLQGEVKSHYEDKDKSGNYIKLREDWWTANRDQVWKALTCFADGSEEYFIQSESRTQLFSNPRCGHEQGSVPTNLDYVPQFLRWFNEWAEEFCRIRKIKIDKTKEECIGKNKKKDCSREGYDCKRTDLKKNEIFMDLECPRCEEECMKYKKWMEKRQEEFNKQKRQYENEIKKFGSKNYDKYYEKFSKKYTPFDSFVETLKEGAYCTNGIIEGKIDFNNQYDTFSHSQYCKSCPIFNLKCANGKCNSFKDITCPKIKSMTNIRIHSTESPKDIYILLNDNKIKKLSHYLKNDFKECDIFKKLGQQKWKCKYKCNLDVCELENFENGIDDERFISIDVLIKRWLKYFLNDYSQIKEKLKQCINNEEKKISCIRGCYKKCECVEKWINKKEEEWKDIKARYVQQYESKVEDVSSKLKKFLKQDMFKNYIKNALNNGERLDSMKESSGCKESSKSNGKSCENNDVINILLNRLKKKIETCKTQHDENKNNNSCKTLPPPPHSRRRRGVLRLSRVLRVRVPRARQVLKNGRDFVEAASEEEETESKEVKEDQEGETATEKEVQPPPPTTTPSTPNPCVNGGDKTRVGKITSVTDVAEWMQRETSVRDGISKLKADASQGTYQKKGVAQSLSNICNIRKEHSNSDQKSPNPCHGKGNGRDTRFKIDTLWREADGNGQKIDVLLPPRRRHMCTSNLEYLLHGNKGQLLNISENKVNDSFLGDVLLAANKEAEFIKNHYNDQNKGTNANDEEGMCRSVRNSFADIGDIIKGTDSWVNNRGEQTTQGNLIKIFGKIKTQLKDQLNGKYKDDTDNKQLRKDWWEANRDKVWEAMKCHINDLKDSSIYPSNGYCGYSDHTPLDDYIPQKLRWLTEWAEWYCKYQSQAYKKLQDECKNCMRENCMNGTDKCNTCMTACGEYSKQIEPWRDQWDKIQKKYKDLYTKATKNDGHASATPGDPKDEKDVVAFLSKLHDKNKENKIYSTASGYIHQEAHIDDCNTQKIFCKDPTNNGDKNKYAFEHPPPDYVTACGCNERNTKPPAPKPLPTPNPCVNGGNQNVSNFMSVRDVAEEMQMAAHNKMKENSVDGEGESKLKGKAEEGQYERGGSREHFKDICKITKEHSNAIRNRSDNPCNGKNEERFNIGKNWTNVKENEKTSYSDVYLPQRREHMCTSNLEYLQTNISPLNGSDGSVKGRSKINDSFLGDVLLSAKFEAEKIKELYKPTSDHESVCRAVSRSFADIGDIIRGRDMWDKDKGSKDMETRLVHIFKKIKEQLLNSSIKEKYKEDSDSNKYINLRKDWWEANRAKVWEAMKCPQNGIKCDKDPPLDDYVPQRLRWMTEWAEWYCKAQKEAYDKLNVCEKCRSKGKGCKHDDQNCKNCRKACDEYWTKIQTWEKQWAKIKTKYEQLYKKVQDGVTNTSSDGSKDETDVVSFLKQLHDKNSDHKIYSTAAGYIHQEAKYLDCNKQNEFCEQKNGDKPTNGEEKVDNEKYAFKHPPHEYEVACKCETNKKPEAPPPQPARPAARESKHDHRARSEDGENGVRPPVPVPQRAPVGRSERTDKNIQPPGGGGGLGRSLKPPAQQPQPKQQTDRGVARILPQADRTGDLPDSDNSDEEIEETETEAAVEEKATEKTVPTTQNDVNVCATVKTALTGDDLTKACQQKYGHPQRYWGWKCISDTTTTKPGAETATGGKTTTSSDSNQGSICVPPRRRKLYIDKIKKWAEENSALSSETQTSGKESSQSGEKLRDAFIQSAAIETFFLWDRYKQLNGKSKASTLGVGGGPFGAATNDMQAVGNNGGPQQQPGSGSDGDPQTSLQSGNIPPDFLRLMFYTLADYKDILEGKNDILIGKTGSDSTKDEMAKREEEIKNAINSYFSKSGKPENSVKTPQQTWWENNGKYIWHGMICALTYDTNTRSGETPKQNEEVKNALLDDNTKKPKNGTHDYTYDGVKLDNTDTQAKSTTTIQPPTLKEFISRPLYFRYLEEWGETFCRERKKRLEKIKGECKVDQDKYKCSGDGEQCDRTDILNEGASADLEGPSCAISCSSYRKWIKGKKKEYDEQSNAYDQEKDKTKNNNGNISDNGFCVTGGRCTTAAAFLQNLGPCKVQNGEGKTIFDENDDTFKHTQYCDPCSEFKFKCENCKSSGGTENKCNGKKITTENFEKMGQPTDDVSMLVSDNSITGCAGGLDFCNGKGIFKSIKENKWKCRNFCGYVVCKSENGNGRENQNKIILINALLKRWLEYFFDDYKKIKHKISHCMKNGNGSKCTNDCPNKCKCVGQWVEKKRTEWKEIKKRFNDQYKNETDEYFNVKSFLETLIPQIGAAKNKESVIKLSQFDGSKGCCVSPNSEKSKDEDAIDCMLKNLGEKAKNCPGKPSGEQTETDCVNHTHVEDEDDTLHDEIEVKAPNICPTEKPAQPENEDGCITDAPQPDVKEKEEEKEEEKDKGDEEEEEEEEEDDEEEEESVSDTYEEDSDSEADEEDQNEDVPESLSPSAPRPKQLPREFPSPELKNAMLFSTILWMVGIGFAAFTYFFLKKKPKSPVDLIRVLDVHKGDYGIPTPKSSNRYIPYVSDTYKGKTYIYMEGDSDSGHYYEDTTDITSSESEYEEMDINDIYPYTSPKYKTLIEVVLEPSKGNGNIPHSAGEPLGDDMVPTTNTFTDEEWSELKHDFISQYIQSEPLDVPKVGVSKELPMNIGGNVLDDGINEKPFITSIHDRDLYSGEEISYNVNMSTNTNNDIPKYVSNNVYSGIDLINDTLSGNQHIDIYDEVLKRKENELFGTNHTKNTSNNSVAKNTNNDPIMNQLDLLHKWLDRHRNICEQWNKKEDILNKLNEEWNKDNNSGDIRSDNHVMNTNVSIEIDMDDPKPKNEFTNMDTYSYNSTMDTILDNMEDDIYYDVNDNDDDNDQPSVNHYITRTPKATTRTLCECELYAQSNYDNDPEMKSVKENFDRQTSQRFEEYNKRMKTTRQKCKDKCDKESQKIILKDKLEKELMDKFATLHTDIKSDAIPTCVCEKSLADKVEKGCLRCGSILGAAMPEVGSIGRSLLSALYAAAVNAATKIGMEVALDELKSVNGLLQLLEEKFYTHLVTATNFNCKDALLRTIDTITTPLCNSESHKMAAYCSFKSDKSPVGFSYIESKISYAAKDAGKAASDKLAEMTSVGTICSNPIVISAIVVVTIAVILLIIYLILRYRRKKKMKKNLQYIKLLEE